MDFSDAPKGTLYDRRGLCYFEVDKSGTVYRVSNDRHSILRETEDSLYQAYFRAMRGERTLYLSIADANGNTTIYRVGDLEALADSVGIARPSEHEHSIRWSYNQDDPGSGRFAWIDVEFLCGCEFGASNSRILAKQLKDRFGWDVVLGSIRWLPDSKKTIKVERKSIP